MGWKDRATPAPSGSDWRSRAIPDSSQDTPQSGIINSLLTTDLSKASLLDPLADIARAGQFANQGNQDLAGLIAENTGQNVASASKGQGRQIPVPSFLSGGQSGHTIDATAIPAVAAAGTLATGSQFLMPQNRLGAAAVLVQPLMEGYQAVKNYISPGVSSKPGIIAQFLSAKSKVSPGDIQQAINDPSVFQAPSVADANAAYGQAAGPLQGAARSLSQQSGRIIPTEADWSQAIDRPWRILQGTEMDASGNPVPMDPQTALEGVQAINRFMRNKMNTMKLDKPAIAELLSTKEQLMGFLENNGTPGMRDAAMTLRRAHISENLGNLIPQNKSGGTDALRGMMMAGEAATAGSHLLSGNLPGALPYAADAVAASPAMVGGLIRNYHSISNPQVMGAAGFALNASVAPKTYVVQPVSEVEKAYMGNR